MRIYDGRLGRFLSVDPLTKKYPELTPYQFASDNPIQNIDLDGLEKFPVTGEDGSGDPKKLPNSLRAKNAVIVENLRKANTTPPTIKHTGGGVCQTGNYTVGGVTQNTGGDPLLSNYQVSVSVLFGSSGLQVIQFVNRNAIPGGKLSPGTPNETPVQQLTIDGVQRTAFVDGGVNSPITLPPPKGEGAPRVAGKPYEYNAPLLARPDWANASWNPNASTGSITSFDVPTAALAFQELKFETYFVLTNYAGTNRDQIVGRLDWSYKKDIHGNLIPTSSALKATNKFSKTAQTIIDHDYKPPFKYTPLE